MRQKREDPRLLRGNGDAADGYNPYTHKTSLLDDVLLVAKVGSVVADTAVRGVDLKQEYDIGVLNRDRKAIVADVVARTGVEKGKVKKAAFRVIEAELNGDVFTPKHLEGLGLKETHHADVVRVAGAYKAVAKQAKAVKAFRQSSAYWGANLVRNAPAQLREFATPSAHLHRHIKHRAQHRPDDDDDDVMYGL
jgi:hypothetical protein